MGSSPGTLVLVRHGQSTFNADDRFTGLLDVPLSDVGVAEAGRAARLLADAVAREPGLAPRRITPSPLVRASTTSASDSASGRRAARAASGRRSRVSSTSGRAGSSAASGGGRCR